MGSDGIRACVVGATGFAGAEEVRLIIGHPRMTLTMITSDREAGTPISSLYPALLGLCDLCFETPDPDVIAARADVAFLAVPHTASLSIAPALLERGVNVIDLSADYRLSDPRVYERWYGATHTSPALLDQAVYGLCELNGPGLRDLAARVRGGKAVLVANPGCYPTATALAAMPALEAGVVVGDLVISDAISGVSGAGRKPSAAVHFCSVDESVTAYGVACHRHTPEMEQTLTQAAGRPISVVFTPHLAPLDRGLLATVYLPVDGSVDAAGLQEIYERRYAEAYLVTMLPPGQMPATGSVAGSTRAQVGIALDTRCHVLVASCAIDNLGKGAAGQALQCANIVLGLSEYDGLTVPAPVV